MILLLMYITLFFFFQAEDGIRDGHVTGVQTCALPIYNGIYGYFLESVIQTAKYDAIGDSMTKDDFRELMFFDPDHRSEERRVGKECRSRRWRSHQKEKR